MTIISDAVFDGEILAELGRRFRACRLRKNISQAELARRARLSRATVQLIEDGADTRLGTIVRVMRVLGLLDALESLLPVEATAPSPLERLAAGDKQRKRARRTGRRRPG